MIKVAKTANTYESIPGIGPFSIDPAFIENFEALVPEGTTSANPLTNKAYVDTKVPQTRTIAGIALTNNISASQLTDTLVLANNSDISGIFHN